jgi:tRNA(adenine34) deaminase
MCLAASQQARIQEVFYGAQDLKGGALSLGYCFHQDQRINHRFQVQYLPSVECGEILTQFFKKKRQLKV